MRPKDGGALTRRVVAGSADRPRTTVAWQRADPLRWRRMVGYVRAGPLADARRAVGLGVVEYSAGVTAIWWRRAGGRFKSATGGGRESSLSRFYDPKASVSVPEVLGHRRRMGGP